MWLVKHKKFFLQSVKKLFKRAGVATSRYLKVELVARMYSTSEMNLRIIMSSVEKKSFFKNHNK